MRGSMYHLFVPRRTAPIFGFVLEIAVHDINAWSVRLGDGSDA
jgi:hypothetical protein